MNCPDCLLEHVEIVRLKSIGLVVHNHVSVEAWACPRCPYVWHDHVNPGLNPKN